MTNTANIEIDDKEVLDLFKRLSYKEQKKSYRDALRKSANVIAKETRKNLRLRLPSSGHSGKFGPMRKGIKTKVFKNGKTAKVHIMGDFRLKFFEKGTNERVKKSNSKSTGKISAYNFFADARNSKGKEALDLLMLNLRESIIKIYNKK